MLLTVINDTLDFSKLEAGKLNLETIPFNPMTLMEEIVSLVMAAKNPQPDTIFLDIMMPGMDGYDTGDNDYLAKPVQPHELLQNAKLAINNKQAHTEASAETTMAMETAMTAISSIGEQGVVLDFKRRSFSVSSIGELTQLIVKITTNYGLENSIQTCGSREIFYASAQELVSILEQELLIRLRDAGASEK